MARIYIRSDHVRVCGTGLLALFLRINIDQRYAFNCKMIITMLLLKCIQIHVAFSSAWTWHSQRFHYYTYRRVRVRVRVQSISVYWCTKWISSKITIMTCWILVAGQNNDLCMRCTHFNVISSPFTSTLFHPNKSNRYITFFFQMKNLQFWQFN